MMLAIDSKNLQTITHPWAQGNGYVVEFTTAGGRPLGNNGDILMHKVFFSLMRDFGMHLLPEEKSARADYLVIPPSGALLDRYQAPTLLAKRLAQLPDKPVIIFPSSAKFDSLDPADMFRGRTAPVLWVLREKESFIHLADKWGNSLQRAGVTLALDHDVVISGQRYTVQTFRAAAGARGVEQSLLVSRLGIEATDMSGEQPTVQTASPLRSLAIAAYQHLPPRLAIPLRRLRTRTRQAQSNAKLLEQIPGEVRDLITAGCIHRLSLDISDPTLCTFGDYVGAIVSSAVVATNRLHVAIPSILLGKRVILVDSGYHKLRGVYENSLHEARNLTFISRDG